MALAPGHYEKNPEGRGGSWKWGQSQGFDPRRHYPVSSSLSPRNPNRHEMIYELTSQFPGEVSCPGGLE